MEASPARRRFPVPLGWPRPHRAGTIEGLSRSWLARRVAADRWVAAVSGVLLAPVTAVLAVLIRIVDHRPGLIGLPRIGQDGHPFTMWKLRTMRDAPGGAASFTVADDDRVTPLGDWLRRYRLDELPQLWNVARGDMALVGPRPEAPAYVDLDDPRWEATLAVRPGIAGPTQVVIHGWEATISSPERYVAEVVPRKLEIDGWYAQHASPSIDLAVVRSVLRTVISPTATTAVHRRLRRELAGTMAAIDAATAS
jgi:lipopolysaccharide/colanic/teichoic acid biosynthesis glycosyltransferase